jgi:hypothetical protein
MKVSKNLSMGIKIVIPLKFWYLVRMLREFLFTQVIIWVNTTLNHIDSGALLPRYKALARLTDPNGLENKTSVTYPNPNGSKIKLNMNSSL